MPLTRRSLLRAAGAGLALASAPTVPILAAPRRAHEPAPPGEVDAAPPTGADLVAYWHARLEAKLCTRDQAISALYDALDELEAGIDAIPAPHVYRGFDPIRSITTSTAERFAPDIWAKRIAGLEKQLRQEIYFEAVVEKMTEERLSDGSVLHIPRLENILASIPRAPDVVLDGKAYQLKRDDVLRALPA
jgi:hypothetical protein